MSSSSSINNSVDALIPVMGVFNSCATVSKNSSFCLSLLMSSSLACFNFSARFDNSTDLSRRILLFAMVSFDSSSIFKTSTKLICSSLTTLAINILEDALPILPVSSFSEKFIKRESAI